MGLEGLGSPKSCIVSGIGMGFPDQFRLGRRWALLTQVVRGGIYSTTFPPQQTPESTKTNIQPFSRLFLARALRKWGGHDAEKPV
jgi:hypothetical protein